MNARISFPRATPGIPYAVTGDLWNSLVEALEWCMGINAAAPLYIADKNGPFLYLYQNKPYFWARITASAPLREGTPATGRWKYAWKEVQRVELKWQDLTDGRTGSTSCSYGECNGTPEFDTDVSQQCFWALSMYEGDNLQAAPVAPTANGTIVLMFQDTDPVNGAIRYTFLHAPVEKIGTLRPTGPCTEADYTNERYWVQIDDVSAGGINDQLIGTAGPDIPNDCAGGSCPDTKPHIVTATNIPELSKHTHLVNATGTPPVNVLVMGVYDVDGTLHYVFEYFIKSIVNQFCYQGTDKDATCAGAHKPSYTTNVGQVNEIDFNQNWFFVNQPKTTGVVCDDRALVDWTGFTGIYYIPGSGPQSLCNNTILRINQGLITTEPLTFTPKTPDASGDFQYPVYLSFVNPQNADVDPCGCSGDNNPYNILDLNGNIYVNPCDFATQFKDCAGSLVAATNIVSIGNGLTVTTSGSICPSNSVNLSANLSITSLDGSVIVSPSVGPGCQLIWDLSVVSGSGFSVYNCTPSSVGTGYSRINFGDGFNPTNVSTGIVAVDLKLGQGTANGVVITHTCSDGYLFSWSGFLAQDCNGSAVGSGTLAGGGGFTTLRTFNGISLVDAGSGILDVTLTIASADHSVTITTGSCGVDLSVPPPGIAGITATDCAGGSVGITATNLVSVSGITLSNSTGSIGIALNLTNGTYTTVGTSGCSVIVDVNPTAFAGLFDSAGSAATAQSNAEAYTDAQIAALPSSYPPSGTAGGDLSGTYPNPTVSGITGHATTITGSSYTLTLNLTGNTNVTFPQSGTLVSTVASADLTGQTAGVASLVTYTPAALGTYRVGGYVNILSISADVIQFKLAWTDEASNSRTMNFFPMGVTSANLSATGFYGFPSADIRVKASTAIVVSVVLTTGIGSISYDCGASIMKPY